MATTKDLSALVARYEAKIASKPTKADDLQTKLDAKIASLIAKGKTVTIDGATVTSYTLDTSGSSSGGGSSSGATGSTFLLTTDADEFSPYSTGIYKTTSNNDTFMAGAGRLGNNDYIDGGAGTDTVNITLASGAAPIIQNVEVVNLTMRGTPNNSGLDLLDVSRSATINVSGSGSGQITNLAANQSITVNGGFGNTIALSLEDSSGTADAVTIVANNASAFNFNITGIETLNLNASGGMTLGDTANATGIGLGSAGVINVSGAGNVTLYAGTAGNINTSWTDVSAINATALQGNLTVTLPIVNQIAINAGTGADTINLGSGLDTLDSIDGGAGTDTVRGIIVGASTVRPTLTNVEVLTLDSVTTGSVDLRNATSLGSLNVVVSNASATFTNLDKALVAIDLKSGTNASDFSFAYANGPSDVTISLNSVGTATGGVTYGDITRSNNTGALTLNSIGGASGNTMSALTDNAAASLIVNAIQSLTMGDIAAGAAGTVTLSATGTANLGIGSAAFGSASTLTIQATGTANVSATNIVVGDDLSSVNISAAGDVSIGDGGAGVGIASGLVFSTATTAASVGVTVSIGSGSTAAITVGNASATSAIDRLTFTLSGSGNVDLTIGTGGSGWSRGTAVVDGVALGGSLTLNASGVSGMAFNVDLGGSKAASGSVISLGALADTVYGGASADTIEGGGGNDELAGRGGADVFVYLSSSNATSVDGIDVITDFGTADTILFSDMLAGVTTAGFTAYTAGSLTAAGTAFWDTNGGATYAVFQRGSDVVIQVALLSAVTTADALNSALLEIVLQGETWNSAFALATAAGGFQLSNIVVS